MNVEVNPPSTPTPEITSGATPAAGARPALGSVKGNGDRIARGALRAVPSQGEPVEPLPVEAAGRRCPEGSRDQPAKGWRGRKNTSRLSRVSGSSHTGQKPTPPVTRKPGEREVTSLAEYRQRRAAAQAAAGAPGTKAAQQQQVAAFQEAVDAEG